MTLRTPDYERGPCRMWLGDCRDILPHLSGVDAVVTDPPYGVCFRGEEWDDAIPVEWLGMARNLTSNVVFTTGTLTLWQYPEPSWILLWYRPASNSRSKVGGFSHWSPVMVYGNPKFPVDAINLHAIQHAQEPDFPHPSPKPTALMAWLATYSCQDNETILDPFMGSGTTGVACIRTGRKFIGIEKEPKYFDIAVKRIDRELDQPRLFPTTPEVQQQAELFAEELP